MNLTIIRNRTRIKKFKFQYQSINKKTFEYISSSLEFGTTKTEPKTNINDQCNGQSPQKSLSMFYTMN